MIFRNLKVRVTQVLRAIQTEPSVDDVVQIFEYDITGLAASFGASVLHDDLPEITMPYQPRFEALFYRCRLISLEESLKMMRALSSMKDDSRHTAVLISGLRQLTIDQASSYISALGDILAGCDRQNLKRLEAEVRLLQACFHIILKNAGLGNINVDESMNKVLVLCQTYPATAGLLLDTYRAVRDVLRSSTGSSYPYKSRNIWWTWPRHEVGSLAHCRFGHPYSTATWSDCPECGQEVPLPKPINHGNLLKETAFVAAMKTQTFGGSWRV